MALTTLTNILRPTNVADVPRLLKEHGDSAMIMGGGTFIHGLVARGLVTGVEKLIDLSALNLGQLELSRKSLYIGASVTYAALERSTEAHSNETLHALLDAIAYPPQQIKNAATVAGCIAGSCPFLDLPIVMLALDASAHVSGSTHERLVPVEDLFVSLFQTSLADDEFMTGFTVPLPSKSTASSFEKLETTANDLSIVSAGVRLSSGWLKAKPCRIFIGGGIGEVPFRCVQAEEVINGSKLEDHDIDRAAQTAADEIEPFGDHRASAEYRKKMTGVLVARNLRQARSRLNQ
ncbi:FAD binding domain-containing protein [Gammaproteobacteria bacterium]|nr:FAD binding domain-containing protein [Gammaproteobacteria bacterium]